MRVPTVVLIFGPPGSGKSTQAALLADTLALEVVDTGRLLRGILYDPARQDDPEIKTQRAMFDGGELLTPSFVTAAMRTHLAELQAAGTSCVIGGSPRTMGEAEEIMPGIIAAYGEENVFAFLLDVPEETCRARSLVRATCTVCGRPQIGTSPASGAPLACRACGGALYMRVDAGALDIRFKEYAERTVPIYEYLASLGIGIVRIPPALHAGIVQERILERLKPQLP